jgi:response regulator RpfG family c-di-GMP phosphodiesterase
LAPVFHRSIPAAPIEQIVLHLLQQVLIHMPNLKAVIKRRISHEFASATADVGRRNDLSARHLKLKQQREFVMENVDVVGKDEARQRLSRLNEEAAQVERELASLNTAEPWEDARVERTVESLVELLRATPETLRTLPMAMLRRTLDLLLAKATVDLETRAVELEFRLPKWAIENPQALKEALGLKDTSVHEYAPEAQRQQGVLLMKFRVAWLGDSSAP